MKQTLATSFFRKFSTSSNLTFNKDAFKRKATIFSNLHNQPHKVFVLPNVWDALSAKQFESAGAEAIATTSAGIAAVLGYPDGEVMPKSQMLSMVDRIVSSVKIPVSIDIETGYGHNIEEICATVEEIINIGAVGINIEDADPDNPGKLFSIDKQVEKINAIQGLAKRHGISLYVNARTDSYWLNSSAADACYEETVKRLLAYRDAGANGIFVPGLVDLTVASRLKEVVGLPINLLGGSWVTDMSLLAEHEINRLSVGSSVFRKVATETTQLAQHMMSNEFTNFECLNGAMSYQDAQDLLTLESDNAAQGQSYSVNGNSIK